MIENKIAAKEDDLVEAEKIVAASTRYTKNNVRLIQLLSRTSKTNQLSRLAITQHGIESKFTEDELEEVKKASKKDFSSYLDLTHIPFISIDPEGARDHDDAIYVNFCHGKKKGFTVWVAVADVSKYVETGSSVDHAAYHRGNSTYFPDSVLPMLPEILSNDLCSLKQNQKRPCLVVSISFDQTGKKTSHKFYQAIIKNRFAISYDTAEASLGQASKKKLNPKLTKLIQELAKAYRIIIEHKSDQGPLNLSISEQLIILDESLNIQSLSIKQRLETHKIVEEMMILANICAAETIEASGLKFLYRAHEAPKFENLLTLKRLAYSLKIPLNLNSKFINKELNDFMAKGSKLGYREVISSAILRTLSQAKYTPVYGSHFGLNINSYTHFTSPIRRYSDIIIHRFLKKIHAWEESSHDIIKNSKLNEIGDHLSFTERRSMIAERETNERYTARFLSTAIGQDLDATISGLSKSGIFIRLHKTGGDGLIPMSSLAVDRFSVNSTQTKMKGRNSKFSFDLGARVIAKLIASNPISGSLILNLVEYEGKLIDQLFIQKSRRSQKFRKKNKRR